MFAVACIAFWCCCRLGELLIDVRFDPKMHVAHSMNIKWGITSNGSKFINFSVPHTKTKVEGDTINMFDSTCECSAINTFEHHLTSNTTIPINAPLFAFETTDKSWSPMRRSWFIDSCDEIWHEEGLSSVKGHGFQIGSTVHLLLLGVDPWIVMMQGRWSSQAFLGYWRKCEEILSLFIGSSFQSHDSILSTMSTFRNRLTGN